MLCQAASCVTGMSSCFETMHAALRELGKVPREQLDELQRIWARDVRDLSYDMEDIVDTFMVEVEGPDPPSKKGAKKIFRKMKRKVTKAMARRGVAKEINDIRERARELAERRDSYNVGAIIANRTPVDPRLTALYNKVTDLVGIDEAKEQVIARLTKGDASDQQEKIVVSIAGFGGLGKTTLAKSVYDEIEKNFDSTAFVSVSRNPDTKKLLKDILYALDKEKFKDEINSTMLDERPLIDLVRKFLKEKRYLIVIDDIWHIKPWKEVIELALVENNMRSRIITTTRNIDVAKEVGGFYMLEPLSSDNSKILFYGRIFGKEGTCPAMFLDVSEKILKKCGGFPLAIVTTSSMLANKSENIKEWNKVYDSIGSGLGGNDSMDNMRKILLLSYYDLPSHLKTCLVYLSVFPEDYEIEKDRLIWRWVAEGFIQQDKKAGNQSFLEIGESYFNELLNRSLIQPVLEEEEDGEPRACRVHDAVLDLIISLSEEECFITTGLGSDVITESKVRWLSLHDQITWPTMKMPKLRSLTIFGKAGIETDPTPSFSSYRLLRVLDLRGCYVNNLASLGFIGTLSHLRYLGLSSRHAKNDSLPDEIGKLHFLQTLDVSETKLSKLPSSIIELQQLMCLRGWRRRSLFSLGSKFLRLPDGLKKLTSLEVLESATVESESIAAELGHLTQLRVLEVNVRARGKALMESLGKLTKLETLYIYSFDWRVDLNYSVEQPLGNLRWLHLRIGRMPIWIRHASFPGLSYLHLVLKYEQGEEIQVLGTLSCLTHLHFRVMNDKRVEPERCIVGPNAFPRLVKCEFIIAGGGVVPRTFQGGAMPRLQEFTFRIEVEDFWNGRGPTVDDMVLSHLPSLRIVTVRGDACYYSERYDRAKKLREKLEHEAAVHPNHPSIRFKYI